MSRDGRLPPGVRYSDLPGSSPDEIEWELEWDRHRDADPARWDAMSSEEQHEELEQFFEARRELAEEIAEGDW